MNAKHFFLLSGLLIFACICVNAQTASGPYTDWNHGTGGQTIGSQTNNTYSAFVINGPNSPMDKNCYRDLVFKFKSAGQSLIRSYRGGNFNTYIEFWTSPYADYNPLPRMHISENGNVGIGTINPGYKLDVIGTIRAREIIVNTSGADFVFEDDYELPTLDEVATHIKENKHLPGIPSAKEMQEDGVGLAELNTKLLQKIEELTLYILQLESRMNSMEQKIN